MKILILGCGYVGLPLARSWQLQGHTVTGWVRSAESAAHLHAQGLAAWAGDLTDPKAWQGLDCAPDWIVHCASSSRGGASEYEQIYLHGMREALRQRPGTAGCFVSSTSVYGQDSGEIVTEESPAEPGTETGRILRQAEETALAAGWTVARVAGIYGPDRGVLFKKFLAGEAVIEGDGTRWTNQIHRDDIVSALIHLAALPTRGNLYNLTDNHPTTYLDYYAWLSECYQKPMPPFGPINPNRKRGLTNKRVSNAKLRATGWSPRYPSFREGVATVSTP